MPFNREGTGTATFCVLAPRARVAAVLDEPVTWVPAAGVPAAGVADAAEAAGAPNEKPDLAGAAG